MLGDLLHLANGRASGVVFHGPMRHAAGYGSASRTYLRALLQLGWRVHARDVDADHSKLVEPGALALVERATRESAGPRPIEMFFMDPTRARHLGTTTPAARVALSVFETMSIPASWVAPLSSMDAVWVPTEFHRGTFADAGVSRDKIGLVPFAVDTDFFAPRPRSAASERRFRFTYASVWDARKLVDMLARAFVEEFGAGEPVELVLQTSIPEKTGPDAHREALARVVRAIGSERAHRVTVSTTPLTQEELRALYASTDLYISTDRNNIWTLPCIESLAMGVPCATADYARATSWLGDDNPLLLRNSKELVETDAELARLRPLYAGQRWAQLPIEEVKRAMRWAYANPAALADLASSGREYVLRTHSIDAVARKLDDAIGALDLKRRRVRPTRALYRFTGIDRVTVAPWRQRLRRTIDELERRNEPKS